jgi:hypothetical protein
MIKNILFAFGLVILFGTIANGQTGNGGIKITLQDKATKEAIPFANVVAYQDGVQVGVATTNMDGEATIKPLAPGKYTVKGVYVGYQASEVKDIIVGDGKTAYVNIPLANGDGVKLDEVEVVTYQVPLIDPDTKSGQTVTREDYQNLATKDVNSVAATTAGVYQADEGKAIQVRGGRDGATTYFVDGVKVFGTPNLPQQSIEQLNVITGGVPAMYGDLTSGAISISTRGPQSKYFGGIELISSQLTDPYGYNSLGFSFGGPIYKKKDSTKRTVLGFFVSGQGNYIKDPSPSFVPIYVLKEDKLQEIKDAPLRPSPSGVGYIRSSEFVTKDDMVKQKTNPNNRGRLLSLNGKLDWAPTANTNLSFGAFYEFADRNNFGVGNQIFNSVNNALTTNRDARFSLSVTQKFGNGIVNKEKSQSIITNPFFRFLVSYENILDKTQSAVHKDKVFNYGYVGKFERSFLEENFAINYVFKDKFELKTSTGTQTINAYEYQQRFELPVKFTPGDINTDAALYTSYLFANATSSLLNINGGGIESSNGIINGGSPNSIYTLYSNFGTYQSDYVKTNREQWRIATSFNADIKSHAITFGLEFDQRISNQFALTNSQNSLGAATLWTRMRDLANIHTRELDKSAPILNTQFSGLVPYYYYNYLYEQNKQTQISESLLEKLGTGVKPVLIFRTVLLPNLLLI